MTSSIGPFRTPVSIGVTSGGEDVTMSVEFQRWINRELLRRVGGDLASTNLELSAEIEQAQLGPSHTPEIAITVDVLDPIPQIQVTTSSSTSPEDAHARLQALEAELLGIYRALNDLQQGYQL